jgi:hypothetical protein
VPRKPSLGPPVLRIENLSTGIDPTLVDDFTGELMPQPNAKVPQSAQEILDALNVAKHRDNQLLLQAAGIVAKPDPAGARRDTQSTLCIRCGLERQAYTEHCPHTHCPLRKPKFTKLILTRKIADWRRI